LKDSERRDLVEVLEDRYQRRSTLVATQLPVTSWHQAIGDETVADAICDRIVHDAYRLELKGPLDAKAPRSKQEGFACRCVATNRGIFVSLDPGRPPQGLWTLTALPPAMDGRDEGC